MASHDASTKLQALFGAVLVCAAIGLTGCGGATQDGSTSSPAPSSPAPATPPAPTPAPIADPQPQPDPVRTTDPCGLPNAAFCDTFDAPARNQGRAGELDATRWSAARVTPAAPSANGMALPIGVATLPSCRAGLPAQVLPPRDTLICDAMPAIDSKHLLVATAAQNYGQNSYRIRQPFDFAGRTGRILFDAEAFVASSLVGWISVEVLEDPVGAPSFDHMGNWEGGLIPKNGFEVQFVNDAWSTPAAPTVAVGFIEVFNNYRATAHEPAAFQPIATARGHLNHFELRVSQNRIEVWGTPASSNGRSFAPAVLMHAVDVNLPFTRGYVSITTHNHASLKYSVDRTGELLDAWVTRWDNVAFDGPVITDWREVEVPDALMPGNDAQNSMQPVVNTGYRINDATQGPGHRLTLRNVDLGNVESARLTFSAWYLSFTGDPVSTYTLRYRLNGRTCNGSTCTPGAWREHPLSSDEVAILTSGLNGGQLGHVIDIALSDLVPGDNTLEFVTTHAPQSYPPVFSNIDLVLKTR